MIRRLTYALALLSAAVLLRAAQPQFWKIEGARDFLEGETEELSVDSEGHVRLAPASRVLHDPEAPYVWSLARDGKGTVYAGTGSDGRILRIEGGKGTLLYKAAELEVHALAAGPNGKVYAGTSPNGKVYAIDASGKAEVFCDLADKYIWALAFDRSGHLLVATGAPGRLHRVDAKGNAKVVFTGTETHLTALALDDKGNVFVGSSPGGIVYRIDAAGKVFVLLDSPYREVKALDTAPDGSLYVAAVDAKEKEEAARPAPPLPPTQPPSAGGAEVTITESFTILPTAAPSAMASPRPEPLRPGALRGAVLRILPAGEVETLWTSSDDTPHALARTDDGVLVGTGNKGKVYRIRDDRTWTMVSDLPGEQVTALQRASGGGVVLATSNPGKVFALEGAPALRGTFTSRAKDTETVSSWGRLRWEAGIPPGTDVQVETRSGNTRMPDSTWSDWSAPYKRKDGDAIVSERSRFLQVRAVLLGKEGVSPVLDMVSAAYLQRNLRPQVQSITVHPPGEVFQKPISVTGEVEILGLEPSENPETRPGVSSLRPGFPPLTAYSRKLYQKGLQTFSWKADDPNGDTLAYDVHYRAVGNTRWRLLRKGLTEPVLAWDTSTVPNGRYVLRITARDTPSNPEGLALSGDKESVPFDVDNTPPVVTASLTQANPPRIRAVARDEDSIIRKAEYSVDGGRWQEVHPVDGINDSLEEAYDIVLQPLPPPGPHIVVVRATDLLGNSSTTRVEIK